MASKKVRKEIKRLATTLITKEWVLSRFFQCFEILEENNANTGLFFELLHEFGHVAYGYEKNARLVYTKVEKYIFEFEINEMKLIKGKGKSSQTLMYFKDPNNLSENWIHAIRGGLEFSTHAMSIKTYSFRSNIFNKSNSMTSTNSNPQSDINLLSAFRNESFAETFNNQARKLTYAFLSGTNNQVSKLAHN